MAIRVILSPQPPNIVFYIKAFMPASFVTILEPSKHALLKRALIDQGFTLTTLPHVQFCAKKNGISCTLYDSGKLVVQGKQSPDWIDFFLEPEILGRVERTMNSSWLAGFQTHLGSDESGKGDLFGPLCVACVLVQEDHLQQLHALQVQDSKNISDSQIREIAVGIWKLCPCEIKVLPPATYNKLWQRFKNLNRLLAWIHATLISEVYTREKSKKPQFALVDQFATHSGIRQRLDSIGVDLRLEERVRAESDPAVAAASVLARAAFLKNLQQCSEHIGFQLPKGSGAQAKAALREIIQRQPPIDLSNIAKVHFKTVQELRSEIDSKEES